MSTSGPMYEGQSTEPQGGPGYGGGPQGGGGYGGMPGGYGGGMMPWGRGGYGGGYGIRRQWPIETKPFFLTSEFAALIVAIIALAITAATSDSVDARLFWILTTTLVSFYMLSRGIAKSGTRSMSADPRENIDFGRGRGGEGGGGGDR